MTYEDLVDFLEHKMSMSHVYQPLLVRALVDAGGVATVRQLAQVFLVQDDSQLLYYEKRIKEMPLKVLRRHEVCAAGAADQTETDAIGRFKGIHQGRRPFANLN